MAMDKDTLGTAIKVALDPLDVNSPTYSTDVWKAVSNEIINHIKTFMEISIPANPNTGIVVSPPSAVTSQGTDSAQTIGPGSGIS
jgi:hypothetical protein